MKAATAQPNVSLMNIPLRIHASVVTALLLIACGPADTLQTGRACGDQPGPRSKQACYARNEPRYVAVVAAGAERAVAQGVDSVALRQSLSDFDARLAKCGARPDTSARPSDVELTVWSCREASYRVQVAVFARR